MDTKKSVHIQNKIMHTTCNARVVHCSLEGDKERSNFMYVTMHKITYNVLQYVLSRQNKLSKPYT